MLDLSDFQNSKIFMTCCSTTATLTSRCEISIYWFLCYCCTEASCKRTAYYCVSCKTVFHFSTKQLSISASTMNTCCQTRPIIFLLMLFLQCTTSLKAMIHSIVCTPYMCLSSTHATLNESLKAWSIRFTQLQCFR